MLQRQTKAAIKSTDLGGFAAEFQKESDRAAAILGAALLDEWLRRLLSAYLIDDKKQVDLLLDVDQPVGSFGARVRLAYCLGLLDKKLYALLTTIKSIRNAFAHQLHGLSFDSAGVRKDCENLRKIMDIPEGFPDTPRFAFLNGTFSAQQGLWAQTASLEAQERKCKVPEWKVLVHWERK